jgi:hypothetical protein
VTYLWIYDIEFQGYAPVAGMDEERMPACLMSELSMKLISWLVIIAVVAAVWMVVAMLEAVIIIANVTKAAVMRYLLLLLFFLFKCTSVPARIQEIKEFPNYKFTLGLGN